MKNKFLNGKKIPALFLSLLFTAVLIGSCNKDDEDTNNNQPYNISGNANGTQVVPSNAATGTGTITGTFDPTTNTLTYTSTWTGLSGAPTSAAFYAGASGVAGTVVGEPWVLDTTMTTDGTVSSSVVLTADQASQLLAGNMYYSYYTATYPGGEIRGQITATR